MLASLIRINFPVGIITLILSISPSWAVDGINPRIVELEGTVRIKKPASEGWLSADTGIALVERDIIRAGEDSRAVLELTNGQVIRIGSRTTLLFSGAENHDDVKVDFAFVVGPGDIWVNLAPMATPNSTSYTVYLREGAVSCFPLADSLPATFRISAGADSSCEVKVYRGLVHAAFEDILQFADSLNTIRYLEYRDEIISGGAIIKEHSTTLGAFQNLVITSSGEIVFKGIFSRADRDEKSPWMDWNRSRDESPH
jgi:hypothetical protein